MTTPDPALNGAAHAPKPATRSAVERMLLEGQGTPAIAKALAISRRSVRGHAVAIRKRWATEELEGLDGRRAEVVRHLRRLAFALEAESNLAGAARTWAHVGKLLGMGVGPAVAVDARSIAVAPDPETVRRRLGRDSQRRLADELDEEDAK